jgi:hypothetical protein
MSSHELDFILKNAKKLKSKDIVLMLINNHIINPNIKTKYKDTLLMNTLDYDIMEALLRNGANINAKDTDGLTALARFLLYHSPRSYEKEIDLLLLYGADIHDIGIDGGLDEIESYYPGLKETLIQKYNFYNQGRVLRLQHAGMLLPEHSKQIYEYLFSGKKHKKNKNNKKSHRK